MYCLHSVCHCLQTAANCTAPAVGRSPVVEAVSTQYLRVSSCLARHASVLGTGCSCVAQHCLTYKYMTILLRNCLKYVIGICQTCIRLYALSLPVQHRSQTTRLHAALSCAAVPNLKSAVHISLCRSLFQVFLSCPLPLWPCGIHSSICLATLSQSLLNVCHDVHKKVTTDWFDINSQHYIQRSKLCHTTCTMWESESKGTGKQMLDIGEPHCRIAQVWQLSLHIHAFICKQNEPWMPLPSQPQL